MGATRATIGAVYCLGTCIAALWLIGPPALAGQPPLANQAQKSDRLVPTQAKGDLLKRPPDAADAGPAAPRRPVAAEPAFVSRGSPARKLIDLAVRDDGIWINSFETRSMPLDALACAEISETIVATLPPRAVERLAEEELMRQTRVCAVNGSLLVTCYGGAATVSLRRSRHGDGCDN